METVNIGAAADDGSGDSLRVAGTKINNNFAELGGRVFSAAEAGGVQAAVNAAQAAGGGTVLVGPRVWDEQVVITDPTPVYVHAFGATLRATANDQTLLRVEIGVDSTEYQQVTVSGFTFDSAGFTGVTGSEICDSLGVVFTDLQWRAGLSVCHLWHNKVAGKYTERCGLERCLGRNPATRGIEYRISAGNASFNNTWMRDVFISLSTDGTTGIVQGATANFERVRWDNVVVWLSGANETGVLFDGLLDGARMVLGVEAFAGAAATAVGVQVGANYGHYKDPYAHDLQITFVGTFASKVADVSAGAGIAWRDGVNNYVSDYAQSFQLFRASDTQPRIKMSMGGISLGPGGTTSPDVLLSRSGTAQAGINADLKFTNSGDGPMLVDRTSGATYRLKVDGGVLSIEAA